MEILLIVGTVAVASLLSYGGGYFLARYVGSKALHELKEQHAAELAALNESHEQEIIHIFEIRDREMDELRAELTQPRDEHGHFVRKSR